MIPVKTYNTLAVRRQLILPAVLALLLLLQLLLLVGLGLLGAVLVVYTTRRSKSRQPNNAIAL